MKNLFSFIALLILVHTTTEAHPDPVLDINGNPLLRGESYYVMPPTLPGGGGGIVQYPKPKETCRYFVSQLLYGEGIPLIFNHVNSTHLGGKIHVRTDLDISFSFSIGCESTDVWKRGDYDEPTKQYFVIIGGASKTLGNGSIGNAFQIRQAKDDYYKFVFCPETCGSCLLKCDDVGIFFPHEGVRRRLSVSGGETDTSFLIRFRKYELKSVSESELKLKLARY